MVNSSPEYYELETSHLYKYRYYYDFSLGKWMFDPEPGKALALLNGLASKTPMFIIKLAYTD